jgi:Domain of Unknown Function (DUF1521)
MTTFQGGMSLPATAAAYVQGFSDAMDAKFTLPAIWNVKAGSLNGNQFTQAPNSKEWTASTPKDGKATIDLGDGYKLELNEHDSQMKIINENTGEETNIWGDPHVDWNKDGKDDAMFWGTTSFELDNGTKITIGTEQWGGNKDAYVANNVTITHGSNAIVVDGLSQNEIGDMSITQSQNGYALDAKTDDGFSVVENDAGEGWMNPESGKMATQSDFDVTKPGAQSELNSEGTKMFNQFLMFGLLMGFMAGASAFGGSEQ